MRKYSIYFVFALFCVVLLGITACKGKNRVVDPKDGPAHLVVDNKTLQVGTIPTSAIVEREVFLINDGSEDLVINNIENLCHCTHAECDEMTISPGCRTRMKIYLNPSDFTRGQQFTRTIIVHSNGGNGVIDINGNIAN